MVVGADDEIDGGVVQIHGDAVGKAVTLLRAQGNLHAGHIRSEVIGYKAAVGKPAVLRDIAARGAGGGGDIVQLHQRVVLTIFRFLHAQAFYRSRDDGERGEQLMADVSEHAFHEQTVANAHATQVNPAAQNDDGQQDNEGNCYDERVHFL